MSDIAWSKDGRLLMACSTDGYCTFVKFDENEIGTPYDGPIYIYEPIIEPIEQEKEDIADETVLEKDTVRERKKPGPKPKTPEILHKTPAITSFFNKSDKTEYVSDLTPRTARIVVANDAANVLTLSSSANTVTRDGVNVLTPRSSKTVNKTDGVNALALKSSNSTKVNVLIPRSSKNPPRNSLNFVPVSKVLTPFSVSPVTSKSAINVLIPRSSMKRKEDPEVIEIITETPISHTPKKVKEGEN